MDKKTIHTRRRNSFSDRNLINPINKEIQFTDFSVSTRTKMKNITTQMIESDLALRDYSEGRKRFARLISDDLLCISFESNDAYFDNCLHAIYQIFDEGDYNDVLDTIEFFSENLYLRNFDEEKRQQQFGNFYARVRLDLCILYNKLFENEYVGYRFVGGKIVRITNSKEIETINRASQTDCEKINEHISKAILYLSATGDKDYKNSIKESITAVETLASKITKNDKATLGELINQIDKKKSIHPALKEAIKKLYGFASDEPGIRHGKEEDGNDVDYEEAEFVLVICSAITNYLIGLFPIS